MMASLKFKVKGNNMLELHSYIDIQPGIIIAPAQTSYAVTENDYVIPWDLQ